MFAGEKIGWFTSVTIFFFFSLGSIGEENGDAYSLINVVPQDPWNNSELISEIRSLDNPYIISSRWLNLG